ncbi:MAG TPA: hypothetical protein VM935_16390 [Chitinophagaceae bacterium]|jgi:hypothetical protein|nr:hypothetical protein [Chitinophagaceae bacterium]
MKKFLYAFTVLVFISCGPKIYKSEDFSNALQKHKTVAILPAEVNMQLRPNQTKNLTAQQIQEMSNRTAIDIQEKMHGWFLRRGSKYQYTVTFQDPTKTNAKLKDAGLKYFDLKSTDRAEIAKILGVDAVMQDRVIMEKPMSDGAAIAVGLLVGAWGATNKVETTINIHDGDSGNLLWKYDYEAAGSVGSSTAKLVDALMRNASKKFPYSAK